MGASVSVNAYLTPHNSQGFELHMDYMDVFVVQLWGKKKWLVSGNGSVIRSPRSDMILKPSSLASCNRSTTCSLTDDGSVDGSGLVSVLLSPGNALFIPRGTLHEATTSALYDACMMVPANVPDTITGTLIQKARGAKLTDPGTTLLKSITSLGGEVDVKISDVESRESLHLTFGLEVADDYSTEKYMHQALYRYGKSYVNGGSRGRLASGGSTDWDVDMVYRCDALVVEMLVSHRAKRILYHLLLARIASSPNEHSTDDQIRASLRRSIKLQGSDGVECTEGSECRKWNRKLLLGAFQYVDTSLDMYYSTSSIFGDFTNPLFSLFHEYGLGDLRLLLLKEGTSCANAVDCRADGGLLSEYHLKPQNTTQSWPHRISPLIFFLTVLTVMMWI